MISPFVTKSVAAIKPKLSDRKLDQKHTESWGSEELTNQKADADDEIVLHFGRRIQQPCGWIFCMRSRDPVKGDGCTFMGMECSQHAISE
uniref:Uncharacterized protein n=1 Tax=Oryza glumipatula TaxID=40148 RepID=A0A0E0A2M8_9ORYZ